MRDLRCGHEVKTQEVESNPNRRADIQTVHRLRGRHLEGCVRMLKEHLLYSKHYKTFNRAHQPRDITPPLTSGYTFISTPSGGISAPSSPIRERLSGCSLAIFTRTSAAASIVSSVLQKQNLTKPFPKPFAPEAWEKKALVGMATKPCSKASQRQKAQSCVMTGFAGVLACKYFSGTCELCVCRKHGRTTRRNTGSCGRTHCMGCSLPRFDTARPSCKCIV